MTVGQFQPKGRGKSMAKDNLNSRKTGEFEIEGKGSIVGGEGRRGGADEANGQCREKSDDTVRHKSMEEQKGRGRGQLKKKRGGIEGQSQREKNG